MSSCGHDKFFCLQNSLNMYHIFFQTLHSLKLRLLMGERPVDLKDLFLKIEKKLLNIFRIDICKKKISSTEIQVINSRPNVI